MEIMASDFEKEVVNSKVPVLVDFFADWCGPCKMMAPVLEEFEKENAGKVRVCKVNIDKNEELAARFSIMSIPTLILFKDGKAVRQSVGYISKEDVKRLVF